MSNDELVPKSENSKKEKVQRQWLSAVVNKRDYKKFSDQITDWVLHPKKQYFTKGLLNNVVKKIINSDDVGIDNPMAIIGVSKLPLSDDALSFNFNAQDSLFEFAISPSNFLSSAEFGPEEWLDLREKSGAYNTLIRESRNIPLSEDNSENLQLDGRDMEFFVEVTNVARALCGPFAKNDFFAEHNDSKYLACVVDNQLFSLLLAIESLDLAEMAKDCSKVMKRFATGAELFYDFCKSICGGSNSIEDLKNIQNAAEDIVSACNNYKKSGSRQDFGNGREIASLCKTFLQIIKKPIGDVVVKSAGNTNGFFGNVGWEPKGVSFGGEDFAMADELAVELVKELFSPAQTPEGSNATKGTSIHSTELIDAATFLQERLCSEEHDYVEKYNDITEQLKQLDASLHDSQVGSAAGVLTTDWINEISEILGHLKNTDSPNIKIADCIAKSPGSYDRKIIKLYDEKGIDLIFSSRIARFEKTALGGQDVKRNLPSLFEGELELKYIERVLNEVMTRLKNAKTLRSKKLREINSGGKGELANWEGSKDKLEISEAKTLFEGAYFEAFTELERGLNGKAKKNLTPMQLLNGFEKEITQSIDNYTNTLEQSGYSGDNSASGVGVLMIGMGQGGQQILRASMAKMLNTLTDERSRNMLNGLGVDKVNMEYIKTILAKYDDVSEINKDELKHLTAIFDDVGILAMNLGPELKNLLSQPYNFIWGDSESKAIKHDSDGKLRRLATNLALLDPNSKGCGGKMGRGRAFAVDAEESLGSILHEKGSRRTITQVCLIHSFTGGSGSGMVLPMLRKIKHTYPEAIVWVLSAGDGHSGGAKNGSQNVIYITSDILQSHYNALHHAPQKIDFSQWGKYKSLYNTFDKLNKKWAIIRPYFSDLNKQEKEVRTNKVDLKNAYSRDINDFKDSKVLVPYNDVNPFLCLPDSKLKAELFESIISDPTNDGAGILWDAWVSWIQLAEDDGSRELRLAASTESVFKSDEVTKERFKTTRGHFIKIARKLEHRMEVGQDSAEESNRPEDMLFSQFVNSLDVKAIEDSDWELGELIDEIKRYAREMRDYHHQVYAMSQLIALNRGANNDPTVKHIIVSNAHLDPAAGAIYDGRQEKFEIYNSTMTEVFVNLVHSLVNESDEPLTLEKNGIISSSYEVMDVSDMRNRTKPTTTAMIVELEDMSQIDKIVRYDRATKITPELFEIFTELLQNTNSPLYDTVEEFTSSIISIGTLKALFVNYFQNVNDGLLRYKPLDVIESIYLANESKVWDSETMNANDSVESFWNDSFSESQRKNFANEGITLQTVKNMYEWIRILPLRIFKQLPGFDLSDDDWNSLTKSWRDAQDGYLETNEKGNPLDKASRTAHFYQFVLRNLSGTAEEKKIDAKLLTAIYDLYGIIDLSHLAALPSALILDTMAKMYSCGDDKILLDVNGEEKEMSEMVRHHPSIVSFSIESGRNQADGNLKIKKVAKRIKLKSPTFLRLNPTKNNSRLLEPSETFYQKFSQIKQEAIKQHPEFATSTIFEMLVHSGSHPSDKSLSTRPEETPSLIKATSQLLNFGVTNLKHTNETPTSQFFRYLLLGTPFATMSREQKVVYSFNMPDKFKKLALEVTVDLPLNLSVDFTSQQMQKTIHERLDRFCHKGLVDGPIDIDLAVVEHLRYCIESVYGSGDAKKELNLREFYVMLETKIVQEEPDFITKNQLQFGVVDLQLHLSGLKGVCSYLQSLTFSVKRQEKFLKGLMKPGEGVSFQFQGSIDAMRSQTNDFIAVVNTTTAIHPDQIRESARIFFKDFGGDRNGYGKVFIQNLKSGPTASITLMSERAATIEIVKNFQSVITKMNLDGLSPITDTLVHPYSFLRNLLWMSTFRNVWIQESSHEITKVFDIPTNLIKTVFGSPENIEQAINSVQQSGDMAGVNLSRYDREAWKHSKCVIPYGELSDDGKKHRLRSQLTIADMLFINLARLKAISDETNEVDRRKKFQNYIRDPAQIDSQYKDIFFEKMQRTDVTTFRFENKIIDDEEDDIWGGGEDEDDDVTKDIEALTEALNKWLAYNLKKNDEAVEYSSEEDDETEEYPMEELEEDHYLEEEDQ